MSCNTLTLSGLAKDCSPCLGGIVEVSIIGADKITPTISDGKVSAITLETSAELKKYHFNRNTGSMTSTYTIDNASGVRYVTTDLSLLFNKMETTKRVEISALAVNDLVVIVKDANGKYWYLGMDNPVNASAADGQTGTAVGDANRYSITLQDISKEMPYEVLSSVME